MGSGPHGMLVIKPGQCEQSKHLTVELFSLGPGHQEIRKYLIDFGEKGPEGGTRESR